VPGYPITKVSADQIREFMNEASRKPKGPIVSELLDVLAKLNVSVFVISCMMAAGLGLRVDEIVSAISRVGLLIRVLIANFVLSPAIAYGLTRVFSLETPYVNGLLLLGAAAGAPFLPKLVKLARGDIAFSVGLMLVLTVGSVAYMPLVLPLLIPGLSADPWDMLRPLLVTMLIPLTIGLLVRRRSEFWSKRLQGVFEKLSNISMILAVLLMIGLDFEAMLGMFASGAVAVATLLVMLSFGAGYVLGWPDPPTRSVLGLGTGQRNVAAALMIATQNLADPRVVVMLLLSTLAGVVVLAFAAKRLAGRSLATPATNLDKLQEPSTSRPIPEETKR
jgi:BASS family bile acid:Na+ symporter